MIKARVSLLLCLCSAIVGCDAIIVLPKDVKPTPVVATTLDAIAEQTGRDYLIGMADLCESTAKDLDAGKYKAQSQVTDTFKAANDTLRKTMFAKLGARVDQDVPPGVDLSAKDTAAAFRKMSAGFRKAGGK